jgi:hypothetical protein
MKRLVIVFGLLLSACPLYALLDPLGSSTYTNFVIKKELWVCTSIAFPVDISYDAFNVDFKTVVQEGSGYFIQVKPGTHTNGDYYPDAGDIIESHARGVMNVIGKPAGVYEYIFVSTADDFCGMSNGKQSVVRIYLVPQPTGFPVLTNVCPGTTEQVDFDKFIPPEIRYFIEEVGWTITYILNRTPVSMPVTAGLSGRDTESGIGNTEYRYTFNDRTGPFAGVYSTMQSSAYYCPQDTAYLTHTVRIREDEEYTIPNKSISFCLDALRLVPETAEVLKTNLFGYLGSSAPEGEWSVRNYGGINPAELTINRTSGDVSIPVGTVIFLGVDSVVFQYSYEDCMERDTFTLLTFKFDRNAFTSTFGGEKEHDVCRNLMSGVVELSSIFGFTAPLTSGVWFEKEGEEFKEMLYGAVDITEMKSGSLYTFRYDISSAIDAMCMVDGSSTLFNIRMHDLESSSAANAEVKICKRQFASGVTVDLSRYVPGLNRIEPSKVIWRDTLDRVITAPDRHLLRSGAEWQTSDTSTYRMQFRYEVQSDCGPYSGNLYISAVDSAGIHTKQKVIICYTDEYAEHVDLFQLLGIVGANGSFGLNSAVDDRGRQLYPANLLDANGVMNASAVFNQNNASETYTFGYLPGRSEDCIPEDDMQITVVITKYVEDSVEKNNVESE